MVLYNDGTNNGRKAKAARGGKSWVAGRSFFDSNQALWRGGRRTDNSNVLVFQCLVEIILRLRSRPDKEEEDPPAPAPTVNLLLSTSRQSYVPNQNKALSRLTQPVSMGAQGKTMVRIQR